MKLWKYLKSDFYKPTIRLLRLSDNIGVPQGGILEEIMIKYTKFDAIWPPGYNNLSWPRRFMVLWLWIENVYVGPFWQRDAQFHRNWNILIKK